MNRRQFLSTCGASFTVLLAGCQGSSSSDDPEDDEGDNSGTSPGPKEVVRNYLNTLYGGTAEKVNAFLHPNAELPEFTPSQMEQYDGRSIQVESIEVMSKESTTAKLQTSVTIDTGSRTLSSTAVYEMRTDDGSWKIYSIES